MPSLLQILFLVGLTFLAACRQQEENPETLDPIYGELKKVLMADEGSLASEKKKLEQTEITFRLADPLTIDRTNAARDISRSRKLISMLEQKLVYEKIRVERRKIEDHVNYRNAFAAGKDWPPKEAYGEWQTNQRLRNADRRWDAHLPKLFSRVPAASSKPTPPKKEE